MATWTYTGDPALVTRDAVRFRVGQTSTSDDILLYDEELDWLISQHANTTLAAAAAAEALAAQYRARKPEAERYGQTQAQWGDRAAKLDDLAGQLRRQHVLQGVTPFVGGASQSDMDSRKDDSDRVQERFSVGRFDYPGGVTSSTEST